MKCVITAQSAREFYQPTSVWM